MPGIEESPSSAATPTVPIIDLSAFACVDDESLAAERAAVASQLRDACENVGFFYIKGHGCPPQVVRNILTQTREFFSQPLKAKEALAAQQNPLWRGYNGIDAGSHSCTPNDAAENLPDYKESFTVGAEPWTDEETGQLTSSPMHGSNQWPTALESFETSTRAYWNALENVVAVRLVQALAQSLDLPLDFFMKKTSHPHSQMVMLKYPPSQKSCEESKENGRPRRGCGAHTDCGFLTILLQDRDGLEVCKSDGSWVMAPTIEDAFVVNLGDMTAHWTNDRYKSTMHRVFNPSSLHTRYSIPFFHTVDYETCVETIPSCRDARGGAIYEPCQSGEYILEKLGLMYLAKTRSCCSVQDEEKAEEKISH